MKKLFFILIIISLVIIGCLSGSDPPEYGIFDGIPEIKIEYPVKEAIEEYPIFEWEKVKKNTENEIFEVIIIFDDEIVVDGEYITRDSKELNAKFMWDSELPRGLPGEVSFTTDIKRVLFKEDSGGNEGIGILTYEFDNYEDEHDPTSPALIEDKTYYWIVIAYSYLGEIIRASKQCEFTYIPTQTN